MVLCAGVLVLGSVIAFTTVRRPAPDCRRPECRTHGAVLAPPLEGERTAGRLTPGPGAPGAGGTSGASGAEG